MESVYFDVSKVYDEDDAELYENLVRSAYVNLMGDKQYKLNELISETHITDSQLEEATESFSVIAESFKNVKKFVDNLSSYKALEDDFSIIEDFVQEIVDVCEEYSFDEPSEPDFDDYDSKEELFSSMEEYMSDLKTEIEDAHEKYRAIEKYVSEINSEFDVEELASGDITLEEAFEAYVDDYPDFAEPIYNYVYPIDNYGLTDEKIVKALDYNMIVIQKDEQHYLASSCCGTDITQYVGYVKGVLLNQGLAFDDCVGITKQRGLAIGDEDYDALMEVVQSNLNGFIKRAGYELEIVDDIVSVGKNKKLSDTKQEGDSEKEANLQGQ